MRLYRRQYGALLPKTKKYPCLETACTHPSFDSSNGLRSHIKTCHEPAVQLDKSHDPEKNTETASEPNTFICPRSECNGRVLPSAERFKIHMECHAEVDGDVDSDEEAGPPIPQKRRRSKKLAKSASPKPEQPYLIHGLEPEADELEIVEYTPIRSQKKIFHCPEVGCNGKPYMSEFYFNKHIESHKAGHIAPVKVKVAEIFKCTVKKCKGRTFKTAVLFEDHQQRMHMAPEEEEEVESDIEIIEPEIFQCTYDGCEQPPYQREYFLKRHLEKHRREEEQNSQHLREMFGAAEEHVYSDPPVRKAFVCSYPVCKRKLFRAESDFQKHLKKVHKQKPEEEDEEDDGQPGTSETFPCGSCHHSFAKRSALMAHLRTFHKATRRMSEVKEEKKGEKPKLQRKCPIAGCRRRGTFDSEEGLQMHIDSVHPEEEDDDVFVGREEGGAEKGLEFPCRHHTCTRTFPTERGATTHFAITHKTVPIKKEPIDEDHGVANSPETLRLTRRSQRLQSSDPASPSLSVTTSKIMKEIVEDGQPEHDDTMESQEGIEEPKMFHCQSAGCQKVFKREHYFINHCEKAHGIRCNSDGKEPEEPIVEEPEEDNDDKEPGTSNLFHCPQCSKTFKSEDRYNMHLVTAHPAILPPFIDCQHLIRKEIPEDVNNVSFQCTSNGCKKSCKTQHGLQRHVASCHPEKEAEVVDQKEEEAWQPRKCQVAKCKSSAVFKTEIRFNKHVMDKHGPAPDEDDDEEEEAPEDVKPKESRRSKWVTTAHGEFANTSDRFFVPQIPEFRRSGNVLADDSDDEPTTSSSNAAIRKRKTAGDGTTAPKRSRRGSGKKESV